MYVYIYIYLYQYVIVCIYIYIYIYIYRPLCVFCTYVLQEIVAFIVTNLHYFEERVSEFFRSALIYSTKFYGV